MKPQYLVIASLFIAVCLAEVVDLDPDNFDSIVDGSKNVLVKFYKTGWWRESYRRASIAFRRIKDVVFAQVDDDKHPQIHQRFNVTKSHSRYFKYFPKGSTAAEEYEGYYHTKDFIDFINCKIGTQIEDPSNVVSVTPDNFDSVVYDSSKHVFVHFYAPWDGHHKAFSATFESLADVYKAEKDIAIVKVDIDRYHDIGQRFDARSTNYLIFFPKDDKTAIEPYFDNRELNDLVTYLNKNTGAQRNTDGRLNKTVGRVEALDALAKEFIQHNDNDDYHKIIEQAMAIVSKTDRVMNKKDAEYYVKVMKKVAAKGKDFVQNESRRIESMLTRDVFALKQDQFDELIKHKNILESFK